MAAAYPSGMTFPFKFKASGGVHISSGGDKVSSNLHLLIKTNIKERLIRKKVGTVGYSRVLRSAINESGLIESLVKEAVYRYEPRAVNPVINVYAKDIGNATHVFAEISFIFKYTSDPVIMTAQLD